MVNLHDPVVTPQVGLAFLKLWHVLAGIFLWEFTTTLDYEWRVFRGHLPYRWTIWVYSIARVSGLMGAILNIVGMNLTTRLDCQVWISLVASFLCLSLGCASLLIVLRVIAIWSRNKVVRVATLSVWGIGVGFHVQYAARFRSVWSPTELGCLYVTTERSALGLIPTIISDLVLLLIMLVGLILLRRNGSNSLGLTPIIIKQGIIWLSVAFLCEAPEAVIATLSSNDQFIDMLLSPAVIIMIIVATQMHRSLVDFAFGSPNGAGDALELGGVAHSRSKLPRVSVILSNRASRNLVGVTVHKAFEQPTTQTNDNGSDESANVQMDEKPTAWDLGDDTVRSV